MRVERMSKYFDLNTATQYPGGVGCRHFETASWQKPTEASSQKGICWAMARPGTLGEVASCGTKRYMAKPMAKPWVFHIYEKNLLEGI